MMMYYSPAIVTHLTGAESGPLPVLGLQVSDPVWYRCRAGGLALTSFLSWQGPEEELNKLLLMKVSDSDQNIKVWLC